MIAYYSTVDRVNRKLSTENMNWHPNFPVAGRSRGAPLQWWSLPTYSAAGFYENKPVFANSVIIIAKSTKKIDL